MFHPDPEVHQIERQLQSANSCLMMISKKKWLVMDNSEMLPQKVDGSLKSFISQPLQKTLTPNTLILGPENMSFRFHVAGVPLQSCFCAVTRRVLWTGQRAGGVCTPSVIVDGSVKNDPNDHEQGKRCHKPFFRELPCATIFFLIYL